MAESWTTVPATEVRAGDRIRLKTGVEMVVSRIEPRFLGLDDLIAFIEDTPARWYKHTLSASAGVEIADRERQLAAKHVSGESVPHWDHYWNRRALGALTSQR
jgi:hypothetical protein